jgi:hypothetical protein
LDEFCFWRMRIERSQFDHARNTYRDEFSVFCLALSLALCLALFLLLCLNLLMDLTALSLDALVAAHVLIVVIVSHIGLFFCCRVSHSL